MALTEVQLDGLDSRRYDPALSYEERSRIRKEEREERKKREKAKTSLLGSSGINYQGPPTSQAATSRQRNSSSSSSSSSRSSSSAKSSRMQNGGHHQRSTPTSGGRASKDGKHTTDTVLSPSPVFSDESSKSLKCQAENMSSGHKFDGRSGPTSPPLVSPTERNDHANDTTARGNSIVTAHTSVQNDSSSDRGTPVLSRMHMDALASLTPSSVTPDPILQRRNTPVLSRAQIETLTSVTPDHTGMKEVLSQRRYTPVLSPGQLRAISAISNDADGCMSPDTMESRAAGQSLNGSRTHSKENLPYSHDIQSASNHLDGDVPRDGRDGALSSLSRQSTHSSSSTFTIDGMDQLMSPTRPKSTDVPSSQSFSSGLQFVDTEEAQTSPVAWNEEPPTSIRGPMQKTNVVYRDHEDSSNSLVTMIPSSGFFDPSQSQADMLEKNEDVGVQDDVVDGELMRVKKTDGDKKKKKGKEPKKGSRRDKLPILPVKGDVSERIVEEEEDSHTELPSISLENEKDEEKYRKDDKEGKSKRLFGSKRRSASGTDISSLSPVAHLHDSEDQKPKGLERSASSSSAKKSLSPFRKANKKTSQSFREDMREKSISPDRSDSNKLRSPFTGTPSPPRSLGSREMTPESAGSDSSSGQGHGRKRKTSFAQKIKSLVGGSSKESKETAKSPAEPTTVTLVTYKKLEVEDLPSPPEEAASDITTSGSNLDIALSFSGSFEESGQSSTSMSAKKEGNFPSRPQSASALGNHAGKSGIGRGRSREDDLDLPEVKSGLNLSPRSSVKNRSPQLGTQRSMDMKGGLVKKQTSSPVAKRPSSASSSSSLSPRSTARKTSNIEQRSPSNSPRSSARKASSPIKGSISPRSSARGMSGQGKSSPTISPQLSGRGTSSPGKGSPSASPLSSARSISSPPVRAGKVVSPLATKKSSNTSSPQARTKSSSSVESKRDGPKKASVSPTATAASKVNNSKDSPRAVKKTSSSALTGASTKSVSPTGAVGSPKASPAAKKSKITVTSRQSPVSSPRTAKKSLPLNTVPSKASPLTKRKITPSASGGENKLASSGSSLSTGNSISPKPTSPGPPSSRKPAPPRLQKVSLDNSSEAEAAANSKQAPGFSRFSNARKPIKLNKSPDVSSQASPIMERSEPEVIGTRTLSESSVVSSGSSQGSNPAERKRRIGVSATESPMASPVIAMTFFNEEPGGAGNQPSPISLDVETLLASVERKLTNYTSASSATNQVSDAGSEEPGQSHNPSHSPEIASSPKFSPHMHEKSASDLKGSDDNVTVVTVKVKEVGNSKQLASPSGSAKLGVKTGSGGAVTSPLSKKKETEKKTPKSAKKSFTSSRPPVGPASKKNSLESPGKPPSSSMGTTRPRMVVQGTVPSKKKFMGKTESSPVLLTVTEEKFGSKSGADATKKPGDFSSSRRTSVFNRSMKSRSSSRIRPGSANVAGRRASVVTNQHQHHSQQQQQQYTSTQQSKQESSFSRPSSGLSSSNTTNRKSMRRLSTMAKPGSSSTLGRDRRMSLAPPSKASSSGGLGGGMYATMRRPKSGSNIKSAVGGAGPPGLSRTPATMSMRLPRKMSVVSQVGTAALRRGSKVGGPPPATIADPSALSPSRSSTLKHGGSLRKMSSAGDVMAAFDHVSAQANTLVTSDHRRAVRPKARQKASASHLKILSNRTDVSSDLNCQDDEDKLDPNSYSTYMSKKNLAPSAMAGLAAKVDFSTVKLRKTTSLQQIMTEQAGGSLGSVAVSPGVPSGTEHNTKHPVMLLQVKGRRNIQTRLVEPSGASLNSGDVFILVTKDKLFHWVGKSANVIEKARGSDVVMRIVHKKELDCKAPAAVVIKEEERAENINSKKDEKFWELLGGKTGVKSSEMAPGDEVYERAMNMITTVYRLEGTDKESLHFVPIHENSNKMVTVDILNNKQIFLFDFYSEMYVWVGNQSPAAFRRKAVELGKQLFDAGCKTPAIGLRSSPARGSGRYRPRNSMRSPRHSVVNMSGRRMSRVAKTDMKPRPEWALFARSSEGSESILFREKFGDWPEAGRIIKMKGHVSSGEVPVRPVLQIELQPADVDKMLRDQPAFEGLRLEGDNIHRGQGNFKVSKSTFSRNRVRTVEVKTWVIKEFDNIVIPGQNVGIFYTSEAYVIRWGYQITIVRELEGLGPGQGIFAKDRAYQRSLQEAREGKPLPTKKEKRARAPGEVSDSEESEEEEEDEEQKRVLESGGRDRCAYFFWQGQTCTINEKGASALMTVELDKEKGPQIRVEQGREPPSFLNLFNGGMIILKGKSETDSLQSRSKTVRVFCVRGQMKNETCLMEITPEDQLQSLSRCLRSRGCYIIYDAGHSKLFVWYGSKATKLLKRCATLSARMLRNRLPGVELIRTNEGQEPNDLCSLLGNKESYVSLINDTKKYEHSPRMFEFCSTTGEFVAEEVLCPWRNDAVNAFPHEQSHLYSVPQPAMFLVDSWTEVYIWLGWWPVEKNKLLKEANATTGSSHSRWLRDKKLALETALYYVKACKRSRTPRTYVVMAGSEHERFTNLFPFWEDSKSVQELNCKGKPYPKRLDLEEELAKYSRTQFKVEELKQKPPPEGVDPARLETYLTDEDFLKVFKVNRADFAKMPQWKQTDKKKAVGLF